MSQQVFVSIVLTALSSSDNLHRHLDLKAIEILVVFLEHDWLIFLLILGNVIIPTDEPIFFRGVGQPATRSIEIIHRLSIDYPYTNH